MNTIDRYPDAFATVNPESIEAAEQLLATFDKDRLLDWTQERTVVHELGGRAFRMMVDRGDDETKAIIAFGEFGNGLEAAGAVARARVLREMVNPAATLILQPNSTLSEDNTNFSRAERKILRSGEASPVVDRTILTLEKAGDPDGIVAYGPSQGGAVALAYSAHVSTPAVSTTVMEAPNVADRSRIDMAKDFAGAGALLKENIANNFEVDGPFSKDLIRDLSVMGLAKYGIGLAKPDNTALIGIMRRATAIDNMGTILDKQGSVVHAWATNDRVSPAEDNERIATELAENERYESMVFENDHSITNLYILNAALAHRAFQLSAFDR